MEYIKECPLCASTSFSVWGVRLTKDTMHSTFVRCRGCGLIFANPRATAAERATYYQEFYASWTLDRLEEVSAEMKRFYAERLCRIVRYKPGGRLLEIGCGPGGLLRFAREHFSVVGVEPSVRAVALARQILGDSAQIYQGMFEDIDLPPESFDVIYAWHVIEHVDDVLTFLSRAYNLLNEDGILVLGTPNFSSYAALRRRMVLLQGRVPDIYTSSPHTYLFSGRTLSQALTVSGFRVLSLRIYEDNLGNLYLGKSYGVKRVLKNVFYRVGNALNRFNRKLEVVAMRCGP